MSTIFTLDTCDFDSKNFIIGIKFPNGLTIDFESDLNNILPYEIKAFMKSFKKNKNCCLDILNSKKNTVDISYDPKESKISFSTWNEGYIFNDIECNYNQTKIEFKMNEEERNSFYGILEELYDYIGDFDSDEDDDKNEKIANDTEDINI
jgi:hypothetical protein